MLTKINKISITYQYLILICLIYFVIFLKLDSFHLRWWDESMFAVNTYEMMNNGHYFSLYFDGSPDLFNTKPPLTIWLQLLFSKIIGYNELSIRLPSAIFSSLSILIIFNFINKNFSNRWAWISALILLTSNGYIGFHTSRTGDSDSVLTFLLLVANINFVNFILKENKKYILYFFLFLTLAFMAKLYAAFLFSFGYLFILIYYKKLKSFIFNYYFLFGLSAFIILAVSIIYAREIDTPGYFFEILNKDAGRLVNVVERHREDYLFYINNFFNRNFSIWIIFSILSVFLLSISSNKVKTLIFSFLVLTLSYLVIITLSITKLTWYDMPLYPLLSVMSGYAIYYFIEIIFKEKKIVFQYILIFSIFIFPYYLMFNKSQVNFISQGERDLESNEIYLYNSIKEGKDLDRVKVLTNDWNGSLLFYKYKLQEQNQYISVIYNLDDVKKGDKILISDSKLKQEFKSKYNHIEINKNQKSILYQIQ